MHNWYGAHEAGKHFVIFSTNDVYACFHNAPSDKVAGTENRACWEMRHGHLMAQSALPLALPWAKKGEGGQQQGAPSLRVSPNQAKHTG